jgi:branched-subunit amino acid aminotransferase/4-amino-4-deoxychorismate lyase
VPLKAQEHLNLEGKTLSIFRNYAPTLQASYMVLAEGYQQVLWLYENQIVEVGASNIFFIFKDSKTG